MYKDLFISTICDGKSETFKFDGFLLKIAVFALFSPHKDCGLVAEIIDCLAIFIGFLLLCFF